MPLPKLVLSIQNRNFILREIGLSDKKIFELESSVLLLMFTRCCISLEKYNIQSRSDSYVVIETGQTQDILTLSTSSDSGACNLLLLIVNNLPVAPQILEQNVKEQRNKLITKIEEYKSQKPNIFEDNADAELIRQYNENYNEYCKKIREEEAAKIFRSQPHYRTFFQYVRDANLKYEKAATPFFFSCCKTVNPKREKEILQLIVQLNSVTNIQEAAKAVTLCIIRIEESHENGSLAARRGWTQSRLARFYKQALLKNTSLIGSDYLQTLQCIEIVCAELRRWVRDFPLNKRAIKQNIFQADRDHQSNIHLAKAWQSTIQAKENCNDIITTLNSWIAEKRSNSLPYLEKARQRMQNAGLISKSEETPHISLART